MDILCYYPNLNFHTHLFHLSELFPYAVGVTHDEVAMKKIAESYDIVDGPNDAGEMFERSLKSC
jgi:hypothetical protein